MIGVELSGVDEAVKGIEAMGSRLRSIRPVLSALGNWMVTSSVPRNFQVGGRPTKWAGSMRWGMPAADVLQDTRHLMRSVGFNVTSDDLILGAGNNGELRHAAIHQFGSDGLPGGVIRPKKKFLTIPIVGAGALTVTQARTMRAREFPGAFPLMNGPDGPGIYVKGTARGQRLARGRRGGFVSGREKTVVRIFAFITHARIPARPYLVFQDEDVAYFLAMSRAYLAGDPNWRGARA